MAFNTGELLDHTFACAAKAEDLNFAAWSGAVTTVLSVLHFPNAGVDGAGKPWSEKSLRAALAAAAADVGINKGTWQTYVNGMFKAAAKLADNATGPAFGSYNRLPTMTTEDACAWVELTLRSLGMETGGHINAWAKQEGFDSYDPDATKKKREAEALARGQASMANLRALRSEAHGSGLAVVATSELADLKAGAKSDLASILDGIGRLTEAQLMEVQEALTARIVGLAALSTIPASAPPVVADSAMVDAKSKLAAHFAKVA